jgi:hypothetical protein
VVSNWLGVGCEVSSDRRKRDALPTRAAIARLLNAQGSNFEGHNKKLSCDLKFQRQTLSWVEDSD